jgi:2-succinyl-5-enolpyruvyl-6-hydroxy-3-cyclohexene-1-carboxylate synthase
VAGERDAFEEHIATPHGLDYAHAAALYGCGYERVVTVEALRAGLARSLSEPGTQILEVRTQRGANLALHRALAAAATPA